MGAMGAHVAGPALDASAVGCGASAILATGGPAAVPFRLCCALTIIHAGGPDPVPMACDAFESGPLGELVGLEDPAALLRVREPAS
jgi:hypothetical protein